MRIKPSFFQISVSVIIITHLVGIVGFLSPWRDLFILITPFHLLISSVLLIAHQEERNTTFWLTAFVIALLGFLVEVAGIQTGLIFGEYAYDTALGPKIWGTPPMIGINWLMLVMVFGALLSETKFPLLIKAMLGALCMVAIDFLIEPVAIANDFWHWESTTVPTHNYLGWLVASFILFVIYYKAAFQKYNPIAIWLLIMQVVFFGILNLFH